MSRDRRAPYPERRRRPASWLAISMVILSVGSSAGVARAQGLDAPPPAPDPGDTGGPGPAEPDEEPAEEPPVAAVSSAPPLVITGYVDVGFAKAQGDGTSFPASYATTPPPGPADYFVDPFAPAVNARGEAASTRFPPGTTAAGFLPRSADIGGKPSFLINTADVDLRYSAPELPVLIFTRLQVLPRLTDASGESTRLLLQQAFGRITPLKSAELAISIGKFDSVFGIEYLENEANFRVGVTPSLLARYTTGQSTGLKVFYRYQLIPIASAVSLNASATNSGTFIEALQGPSRSLTGRPIGAARLGYELNLARVSVKLGASAAYGPRNDQSAGTAAVETLLGVDARLVVPTLTVSAEYIHLEEEDGGATPPKLAGTGPYPAITEFYAHGFWIQAAEELPLPIEPQIFRFTVYARYERRHGEFPDYAGSSILVERITGGVNLGFGESLQVKAEYLANREVEGAPQVANNVFASSAVWTW